MIQTEYKFHPLTEACIMQDVLYRNGKDTIQHDQWLRDLANKYDKELLLKAFHNSIGIVDKKRPAYRWGYFKATFQNEIFRLSNEAKLDLKQDANLHAKKEVNAAIESDKYKLFAQCSMVDFVISLSADNTPLVYNDEDYEMYEKIKEGKITDSSCEKWIVTMRSKGYGKSFDKHYKEVV